MWKKAHYKNYFIVSLAINLIVLIVLLLTQKFLPPVVPLFYGLPVGEAQLTTSLGLLIAPIATLLLISVNFVISYYTKDEYHKKILAFSALVLSILMAITITKIVLLVGLY